MHSGMIKFLDEHKILFKHQFGFQKHKSTTLAILDLYTKLVENIEGKRFSCCIFLDFSKAFDTVNHNIPLEKLEHYGIRGIAQSWFKSYLTDRQQTVSVMAKLQEIVLSTVEFHKEASWAHYYSYYTSMIFMFPRKN